MGRKRKNADLYELLDQAYYHDRGRCLSVPSLWDAERLPKENNDPKRKDAGRGKPCPFCEGIEDAATVRREALWRFQGQDVWEWVTPGRAKVIRDQIEESRLIEENGPAAVVDDLQQDVILWLAERPAQHSPERWAAATRMHIAGKDLASRTRIDDARFVPLEWQDAEGRQRMADERSDYRGPVMLSAEEIVLSMTTAARYGCQSEPCALDLRLSTAQAAWAHELLDSITDEYGETGMTDAGFESAADWLTAV